ncbi:hypothetical protein [Nocardia aurantia]|uniref:Uncharacterized protein n=1 Tax=Nocardia aurantia TaxID=2585199 RepID=A0A7K0DVJ3_9NOCA|nr:hypothetical protein [Nocardia aurantia]MQY29588.1 hypothetical protein [Nocardia aurantia]
MILSVGTTRLPRAAHSEIPWRIHEIAPDFEIEDVWALPTPGGPDDFPRLISAVHDNDFPNGAPLPVRAVMAFLKPFRHLLVYPALIRIIAQRWSALSGNETPDKGPSRQKQ